MFGRESHMVGQKDVSEAMEIHAPVCRQHSHNEPLTHLHDYDFGHVLLGGMKRMGDFCRAKCFRMGQQVIVNSFLIEICVEYGCDRHGNASFGGRPHKGSHFPGWLRGMLGDSMAM